MNADASTATTSPASPHSLATNDQLQTELASIRRRLTWLTAAVFLVAFALLLTVAATFGAVVDFHASEGVLIAGACTGGTVMGFLFGWLAARRAF